MCVVAVLLSQAAHLARLAFELVATPTGFLLRLIFRHGRKHISQVAYNLAASRAAEALREDALFVDPLAKHFVKDITEVHRRRRQSVEDRRYGAHDVIRRSVSYTITRTKYLDDAILVVLGDQEHGSNAMFDDVHEVVAASECFCQQVVMLGSGFDSRPWRLPLGATRWFEVDLNNVISEKQRHLVAAGASMSLEGNARCQYPMQCLSMAMISANVRRTSWMRQLEGAGLKQSVATVWVMEGLLVYLEGNHVERLLRQLCDASPVGSFLMASIMLESALGDAERGPTKDSWKWGCPNNVEDYFDTVGWSVVTVLPWTTAARMYGCRPRKRSFSRAEAQLLIAVKA